MGIIYLVQPAELVGTSRFKIGRSSKNNLIRVRNGYKKGTRYLSIILCGNKDCEIEKEIIIEFNNNFKKIAGNEYFEGDEYDMIKLFNLIVNRYNNNNDFHQFVDNTNNILKKNRGFK
jgi:hypothetical protein